MLTWLLAATSVVVAVIHPDLVSRVVAVTIVAIAVYSAARAKSLTPGPRPAVMSARVLIPVALVGFAIGSGGLTSAGPWTLPTVVTFVAYPLIVLALLADIREQRVLHPADLLVEALLLCVGASIVLHIALSNGVTLIPANALVAPSAFVGLDVAIVVIVGRSFVVYPWRRSPLMWSALAGTALLCGHTIAALAIADSTEVPVAAGLLVSVGIVALGMSLIHSRLVRTGGHAVDARIGFSFSHAVIVLGGLVGPAGLLAFNSRAGNPSSPEIVGGIVATTLVLGAHVIGLMRARAASEHEATHDRLTGLPNRVLLMDRIERAIAHAARGGKPVGVLSIDLDEFKNLNDSLGHRAGDDWLRATADCLVKASRTEDTVARLSQDEFVLVAPHLSDRDAVLTVARRVLDALDQPTDLGGKLMHNPASVGVAVYPDDGETAEELLGAADTAMRRAKIGGGARVEVFNRELSAELAEVAEIEAGLVEAIRKNELELYYQPIVDPRTGFTTGAEALVRWNHPERGFLAPVAFIPIAEQSDLIVKLGEWVIANACRELTRWAAHGFTDRSLSVNVSGRHFSHDLVSTVTKELRSAGANPANLTIELTESTVVGDLDTVARKLSELDELGVKAALDDFGTGYCGLRYLVDLPVSFLKIDRSFVAAMTPRSEAIVAATIAMGRTLGLTTIAEGVETVEQLRLVVENNCDLVQGYKIARPMPADQFLDLLQAERSAGLEEFVADAAPPAPHDPTLAPSVAAS